LRKGSIVATKRKTASGLSKGCREIIKGLKAADVRVFSSVTDTYIGSLIGTVADDPFFRSVRCCSEEEAVAVAVGASLAGQRSVCIFQNAGLLSSGRGVALAQWVHAPTLILLSHRGDHRDPVYFHIYKGRTTEPMLDGLGVGYAHATQDEPLSVQVARSIQYVHEAHQPFVLLLSKRDVT
jgi:sulfopyruvate decarboxylase TPP-binding subunit